MSNERKSILLREDSEILDVTRVLLIVLVVFIHVLPETLTRVTYSVSGDSIYTFISELISHSIGRIAVPTFFVFSGYFFFLKMGDWNFSFYTKQLKKRFWSIVIPYFLWITFAVLANVFKYKIFSLLGISQSTPEPVIKMSYFYYAYWGIPANYPLWYLRDLICMILLSPIFYYWVKALKQYGIIVLLFLYLAQLESGIPGLSSTAIFFFCAGAYLGIEKKNIVTYFSISNWIWPLALFVLPIIPTLLYGYSNLYEIIIRIYVPIGIVSIIALSSQLCKEQHIRSRLIKYSSTTFFVYAIHKILIIDWIKGFFYRIAFFRDNEIGQLLSYFTIPVITICICLALYYFWRKYSPKSLAFVTGNR